ncbi:hypothetical protein F511_06012 [Dorcoceras hygrometricum]|uniref:Membrane transporter protein n=1 Tax=Dorcoceras hygrometricum TaxID=472368 RepID=A0A2Z7AXH6_9LAMI|nr:hypothetical protein F511_06012 [Dorcoceras hygrometricum]
MVGTVIGFFGAALGSVGGVGGDGIFVPMFILIIGYDPKSSTTLSKWKGMIIGAAISTVFYNLHLTQSNLIFAEWMVTFLLIILFVVISSEAFFKGIVTWKKESIKKKVA